ncbi:hypothetical protein GF312_20725, partial [Candidatus Poribacteria bacterium]|nr:hypothetical protein [Candidatus Poribacteria bacterium]
MKKRGRITWKIKPRNKSFKFLESFCQEHLAWNYHEVKRDILSCYRSILILCLSIYLILSGVSPVCGESEKNSGLISQVSTKFKMGLGYDNNVSERIQNPVKSRYYQFYVNSNIYMLPTRHSVLSIKLQDG